MLEAEGDRPVLVDFYAPWCGPCQLMAKVLEQIQVQLQEQVKIIKINTDTYPAIASENQVYALPTLVLYKNGQALNRLEGALSAEKLLQWLRDQGV